MPISRNDSYYTSVASGLEIASAVVPENGKTWIISSVNADASASSSGWVALIWDYEGENSEMLFLTYTSKDTQLNTSIIGDGVKKLAIVLHNDSNITLTMGCKYEAREL